MSFNETSVQFRWIALSRKIETASISFSSIDIMGLKKWSSGWVTSWCLLLNRFFFRTNFVRFLSWSFFQCTIWSKNFINAVCKGELHVPRVRWWFLKLTNTPIAQENLFFDVFINLRFILISENCEQQQCYKYQYKRRKMKTKIAIKGTIDPLSVQNFLISDNFKESFKFKWFKARNFIGWWAWDWYWNILIHYFVLAIWLRRASTGLYILTYLDIYYII